ncbi:hypothetical protein TBLA_0A02710 [Henningerozyma blattae CBS 6284]|uniref:SGNH hydrolase-type esterase domain-containing protein n=1 Tax=Henningerozyma blattae (strain ATCC 34711 / CBS 6284 / DSM 70876 / NBRC 10599 / NRRL Y-10934 / UCD 77-7) TaxID=1071380 RepID=I2GVB8_HENB6|nr:hypothetical protein TBLA_0A02710 [Tetrapisispora blattae CBS 6284]CCH58070.1 hypothetical protein TBLA_0A02710 [Tetrapisispora blattae CBS 6284]
MEYKKFLLFGDSITEFSFNYRMEEDKKEQFTFGGALVDAYRTRMDILHRGFSGYNTRWALTLLPRILANENNIAIATIFFGPNDASISGPQRVPLDEYISNSGKLVELMKQKNILPIVIGPATFNEELYSDLKKEDIAAGYVRTDANFGKYSDALEEFCKSKEIPYINLRKAFLAEGSDNWKNCLSDGLHFNGKGYKILFNELMTTIDKYYPNYLPENIPPRNKYWRDVKEDGSNL